MYFIGFYFPFIFLTFFSIVLFYNYTMGKGLADDNLMLTSVLAPGVSIGFLIDNLGFESWISQFNIVILVLISVYVGGKGIYRYVYRKYFHMICDNIESKEFNEFNRGFTLIYFVFAYMATFILFFSFVLKDRFLLIIINLWEVIFPGFMFVYIYRFLKKKLPTLNLTI